MRRAVLIAAVALAGCSGNEGISFEVTGEIEGVTVNAGSRIGGRVVEIPVSEGGSVHAGDVLVRLDDAEAQAAVQAARARVDAARATLAKLEAGATEEQLRQAEAAAAAAVEQYRMAETGARREEIRAAAAALDGARALRDTAQADFDRVAKLYAERVVSQRQYDQAKGAIDAATAQHDAAAERHAMLVKGARDEEIGMAKAAAERAQAFLDEVRQGPREEDKAAARAAVNAAEADLARAETVAREMVVTAPADAYVESIPVRVGDLVQPGPVVQLVDPDDLEVMVYVSAALLGHLKVGQALTFTADAHGDETFTGVIIHIASQGEYTPRNLQTQEERVQQVFGVKCKLDSAKGKLRGGMTVTAHLPGPGEAP